MLRRTYPLTSIICNKYIMKLFRLFGWLAWVIVLVLTASPMSALPIASVTPLGVLEGSPSLCRGINAGTESTGYAATVGNTNEGAFLYSRSVVYNLNSLIALTNPLYGAVTFTEGIEINDRGQSVANGKQDSLLTPPRWPCWVTP